jgi:RNA-binding proteins (RRM domain)
VIPLTNPEEIDVVVSGLPETVTAERIQKLFKKCGDFDIKLPKESKGVVVLRFASKKYAEKALELNGGEYKGRTLLINTINTLPIILKEKPVPTTVFVGNLASSTTEDQLKGFFSGAGKIKAIRLNLEKGFAHVEFTNRYAAQLSEKLVGGKLNGQRIKIDIADKKTSK